MKYQWILGVLLGMGAWICPAENTSADKTGHVDYWQPPAKKIIGCGWEQAMSVAKLKEILPELEKNSPYSGISLRIQGQHEDGYTFSTHFAFSPEPSEGHGTEIVRWKYEWFKKDIAALRSMKFTRFKDNFIWTNSRDGKVDWFNDQNWSDVCNNFAVLAKIAKETKLKGLIFDAEWYRNSNPVFSRIAPGKSYAEMAAKARQRGQEWGKAIFGEYPDITLFCLFMFSWKENLRSAPECCDLTVPFFNGVYDVLPPSATLIEGHEYHGYASGTGDHYAGLRCDMAQVLPMMVDKSNIEKFRRQTRLACALYLDPYVFSGKPDTFRRRIGPEIRKSNALTVLRRNLFHALNTTDEYVWIWSEGARWHYSKPGHPGAKKVWQQEAPGIRDCFESVQEPLTYARRLVAEKSARLRSENPDFSGDFVKPNCPRGYDFWLSDAKDKGTCMKVPGGGIGGGNAVSIAGCSSTLTFTQEHAVAPDQMYYIRVKARFDKVVSGQYAVMVQFCDSNKRFCWYRESSSCRFGEPDADGWRTAELTVLVPQEMNRMFVRLYGAWMQPEDKLTIGLFEVYRLKENFLAANAQ